MQPHFHSQLNFTVSQCEPMLQCLIPWLSFAEQLHRNWLHQRRRNSSLRMFLLYSACVVVMMLRGLAGIGSFWGFSRRLDVDGWIGKVTGIDVLTKIITSDLGSHMAFLDSTSCESSRHPSFSLLLPIFLFLRGFSFKIDQQKRLPSLFAPWQSIGGLGGRFLISCFDSLLNVSVYV